jgi:hypothetical protein
VDAVNVPPQDAAACRLRVPRAEKVESVIGAAAMPMSARSGVLKVSLVAAAEGLAARAATATRTGRPPQITRRRVLMSFGLITTRDSRA